MSNLLELEIISPQGTLFKGSCHLAVVPSVSGDIGVMVGHESFTASLREGKITIYDEKQNIVKEIAISASGGFAQIDDDEKKLSVLVNS